MRTVSKRQWNSFEERRLGGLRYFVGGAGPPIVLVHGLGGMASNWRLVAPELAEERRVIVPELPGHGGSEPLADVQSSTRTRTRSSPCARRKMQLPAPWVGHSLGGLVGLRAALRRPEAVTGLVLAAGAGISSATRIGEATVTVLGVVQPGRLIGRWAARRFTLSAWAGSSPSAGGAWPTPWVSTRRWRRPSSSGRRSTRTRVSAGRVLVASDPRPDLDRVRCPCLCLWGARDNWVPLKDGMEYARRLRAPLRTISDCGHLLIGERPEAVVRAVRDFVAGLEPG